MKQFPLSPKRIVIGLNLNTYTLFMFVITFTFSAFFTCTFLTNMGEVSYNPL